MPLGDIDKTYNVQVCKTCRHPGGQHILNGGCRLCDCAEWIEGGNARWSDRQTLIAEAEARIAGKVDALDQADAAGDLSTAARDLPSLADQFGSSGGSDV